MHRQLTCLKLHLCRAHSSEREIRMVCLLSSLACRTTIYKNNISTRNMFSCAGNTNASTLSFVLIEVYIMLRITKVNLCKVIVFKITELQSKHNITRCYIYVTNIVSTFHKKTFIADALPIELYNRSAM